MKTFDFVQTSDVSLKVLHSNSIKSVFTNRAQSYLSQATAFFALNPTAPQYQIIIPSMSLQHDIWVGNTDQFSFGNHGDKDLYYAFGHVTPILTNVRLTIDRDLVMRDYAFDGSFIDDYDYDYYDMEILEFPYVNLATLGAFEQAGYGTLGNGGRVFRSKVSFTGIAPYGDIAIGVTQQ